MIAVFIKNNNEFEKALRRFETECRKAYIIQTAMNKAYYQSPSEIRHARKVKKKWRLENKKLEREKQ